MKNTNHNNPFFLDTFSNPAIHKNLYVGFVVASISHMFLFLFLFKMLRPPPSQRVSFFDWYIYNS